jgi:hypothetical protein
MLYYVFYDYDWYDNGGVGFEEFDCKQKALDYIEDILKRNDVAKLENFVLIEGKKLQLHSIEVITKIKA